jgi:hypothetical protein
MDVSVMVSPLITLAFLCAIGGGFGAFATAVASRFGRARVVPLWIVASVTLGSLGATRALLMGRSLGLGPDRLNAPGLFALLVTTVAVILSVPTFEVWRRAPQTSGVSYVRRAVAATAWSVLGVVLVVLMVIVLDLANVPFVPVH